MRRTKNKRLFYPRVLVYCDGETENNYFISMKSERYHDKLVVIEPKLPKHRGFKKVLDDVSRELSDKSTPPPELVFIVLDMDTIYDQRKINEYLKTKEELLKRWKDVIFFIESRPCIEFWFLLHFVFKDRIYSNCKELINDLKKYMVDYSKKQQYTSELFDNTKDKIDKAICNAKKIMQKNRTENEEYSYTKVYKLIEKLDNY